MSDDADAPEDGKRRYAIFRPQGFWYVAAASTQVTRTPRARRFQGVPVVLFRTGSGGPVALLDRCAHRNVPLSGGRMRGDRIERPYHGWQYDPEGVCRLVPALCGPAEGRGRRVASFPVTEQQGFV